MLARSVVISTIWFGFAAAVFAQDPAPQNRNREARLRVLELERQLTDEIVAQLRDQDLKVVANAAFSAAERRLQKCGDELRKTLARLAGMNKPRDLAWNRTVCSVLDALAETGAKLSPEELAPFVPFAGAIVHLVTRSPDEVLLLRAFRELGVGSEAWRACGTVLAARRNAAFVAELLRLPTRVLVRVVDAGEATDALLYPHASSVGCSIDFEPAGWPPSPRYTFVSLPLPASDREPTSDTADLVVVRRWLRRYAGECCWSAFDDVDPARETWLRHLLALAPGDRVPAAFRTCAVAWEGGPQLLAAIEAQRDTIRREVRALVDASVAKGLVLAETLAGRQAVIQVELWDERTDTTTPLPQVR